MQRQVLVLLFSMVATSVCAFADGQINFGVNTATGEYTYAGGVLSTVQDIGINTVGTTDGGSPALTITDGELSFATAANGGSSWNWGAGGTLTLTGCVLPGGCDGSPGDSTQVVFDATFSTAQIVDFGGVYQIAIGALSGSLDSGLAASLGISSAFTTSSLNLDVEIPGDPGPLLDGETFANAITDPSGTDSFTVYTTAVPEDWSISSTLGIFTFGAVVFGIARRRGVIKAVGF